MGLKARFSRTPPPQDAPPWRAPGAELEFATERDGTRARIALTGELDLSNARIFADRLLELEAERPAELEIDLRGLSFMDSSGLAELFAANRRAHLDDRRIVIVKTHGPIERVLQLARVEDVIDVVDATPG
jgi:anti-anti-sigma factor